MSILSALRLALAQLGDPAFRRVFLLGLVISALVFLLVFALLLALVPLIPDSGIGWLDTAIDWAAGLSLFPLFLLTLWLLFPAVMTGVMSLFLDRIVDAVEAAHYGDTRGIRRSPLLEAVWLAVRLSLLVILFNLVALPLYLVLLFTGFGSLVLYLAINGYLMGREYFEMVAVRHGGLRDAARWRRERKGEAFMAGIVIAALFMVPLVNLAAPVIGAAMMTHLFHGARRRGAAPAP